MTLGTEWLIDASGCDAATLANLDRMRAVFDRVIRDLDLHVLGEVAWHQFDHPEGVSGLALLANRTSVVTPILNWRRHIQSILLPQPRRWHWEPMLKEMLGATEVHVRVFERMVHEDAHAMAGAAK